MMPPTANRADLVGAEWSTPWIVVATLALLGLWITTHYFRRVVPSTPTAKTSAFVVRAGVATVTLWLVFHILARAVYLASSWPLWLTAILSGIAIEIACVLYQHEQAIVSKKHALRLIALRIAAILTLTLILLQPVIASENQRRLKREIVVLVDDSASMQLADRQATPSEKLQLATLFDITAAERESSLIDLQRGLHHFHSQLAAEARILQSPAGVSDAAANALISRHTASLARLLDTGISQIRSFVQIAQTAHKDLGNIEDRLTQNITRGLTEAQKRLKNRNYSGASAEIQNVQRQIDYILEQLPALVAESDSEFYESLDPSDRSRIMALTSQPRIAIGRESLRKDKFIEKVGNDYHLRFIRFGSTPIRFDGSSWFKRRSARSPGTQSIFRGSTDLTSALDSVIENVPADKLAGILLLSDGRDNGKRSLDEISSRLGIQQTPICAIVIGSTVGPKDAGILDVRVPETIYLDDRAIIQADLKLDGLTGETVSVALLEGELVLQTQEIELTETKVRTTVRFAHTPAEIGISEYAVTLSHSAGEAFKENNRWKFNLAVTDDRTNVLLVESFPRWEFRYLRNLFHARDKSVHLQSVLLNPDEVADTAPPEPITASATRPFGDSEATELPTTREEWQKFDAIILGDVPPAAIDAPTWEHIRYCVGERGTLLVTIAGKRFMPHAHTDPILKELLPLTYGDSPSPQLESPEPAYRLRLTEEGSSSLIMEQALDPRLNQMIWNSLPPLHWRSPITGLKPGGEVLAFAHPINSNDRRTPSRKLQIENALITSQRYAAGNVVALNFDRTWRLRYGAGDTHHHKFWGQLLRWGTGEILRAGNQFVRLGTDKLSYRPDEPIRITAKISLPANPAVLENVMTNLRKGDRLVLSKRLTYRQDSNRIYEIELPPVANEGRFQISIESQEISELLTAESLPKVETEFIVESSQNAIELAEVTADPKRLEQLATLTGGGIATPDNATALRRFFAPPGQLIRERSETTLWDNFPILLIFLALLTTEWIIRRKSGLA